MRKLFTIIFCLSYVLSIVVTIFLNALSDYKVVFDLTMATLIANVHLGDKIGWSPLHKAARYNHVEAISALLKGGANVNQLDKDLASPLYYAAIEFQVEAIDALIKAGANVNQLTKGQVSILWLAARCNHREAVSALLDAGADPHIGDSPLDADYVKDEMKRFIRERTSRSD